MQNNKFRSNMSFGKSPCQSPVRMMIYLRFGLMVAAVFLSSALPAVCQTPAQATAASAAGSQASKQDGAASSAETGQAGPKDVGKDFIPSQAALTSSPSGKPDIEPKSVCEPGASEEEAIKDIVARLSKTRQVRAASPLERFPDRHRLEVLLYEPFTKDSQKTSQASFRIAVIDKAKLKELRDAVFEELKVPNSGKQKNSITEVIATSFFLRPDTIEAQEATRGNGGTDFKKDESTSEKTLLTFGPIPPTSSTAWKSFDFFVIGCSSADKMQFYGTYELPGSSTTFCALMAIALCVLFYVFAAIATFYIHDFTKLKGKPNSHPLPSDHPTSGINYATIGRHFDPVILTAGSNGRGSPIKLQVLFFSLVVFGVVFYIWMLTGRLTALSDNVLLLMGITGVGATAAAGTEVAKNRLSFNSWAWLIKRGWLPQGGIAEANTAEWKDIFTTDGEFDVYRFQMITFSVLVGAALVLAGATATDLSAFQIPTAFLGILGLSQTVYIAGKLVAPPAISDLDKGISDLQTAEDGLINALDSGTLAGIERADIYVGTLEKLDQPKRAYEAYVKVWETTKIQFESTLGRLVPKAAISQRPPFRVPAAITSGAYHLLSGRVGVPYRDQLIGGGGTKPYQWSVDSNMLPPGLTMTADGCISGTPLQLRIPAASVSYEFDVTVKDASVSGAPPVATPLAVTRTFAITIDP